MVRLPLAALTMDDFIQREQARADSYRLLATCFCQPDRDLFLNEGVLSSLAETLRQLCPAAADEASRMKAAFPSGQEELLVEYARLFVGPHELTAPPYGSVYLDGQREVMGPSTREVIRFYQDEGLALDEGHAELPDHITVELEFLYYLITCEIKALRSGDAGESLRLFNKQKNFLDTYVLKWVPRFCRGIEAETALEYYRTLAACLSAFLTEFEADIAIPESVGSMIWGGDHDANA